MTLEYLRATKNRISLVAKPMQGMLGSKMRKDVGLRIKKMRKAQCLTIEMLATLVGVTKGYISQLENGKVGVSSDTAYRIADVLHMEVPEITDISNLVDVGPEWLRFLKSRYDLTMGDERVLQEIARDSRMPLRIPGESEHGYRERWDSFYKGVMKYLSQPKDRFFADPEVRYVLAKLSIPGAESMQDVRDAFMVRVQFLCGAGDGCESIARWRMEVERRLNIRRAVVFLRMLLRGQDGYGKMYMTNPCKELHGYVEEI